jgi:hypothetical protein
VQQQFEQQPPEQQRSLTNRKAVLLSVHMDLSKRVLSLWMSTAAAATYGNCFSAVLAPVVAPLVKMTMQQLLTCSVVTASTSRSSSSSGSDVHALIEAVDSSLSQVFRTTDSICFSILEGIAFHSLGQGDAAALQDATSDDVMRLLLVQLAAATEQLYYQQRRKLRKASAAASSSSNSAAEATADLPEPYHQQPFTALGLPAVDKVRRSNEYLTGLFLQDLAPGVRGIFVCVSAAALYRQEQRAIEPLRRDGSCSRGPAGTCEWTIDSSSSSSSSSRGEAQVPDPVIPADLIRPLLLTLFEVCMLDTPLDAISSCCKMVWVLLASSSWLPGSEPPGSSAAAAAAAAAQLQQQLGEAAGAQQVLQLMLQQVAPVVLAAYKRGKLASGMRRVDEDGSLKDESRNVTIQGFGGASISLVCSGAARCV